MKTNLNSNKNTTETSAFHMITGKLQALIESSQTPLSSNPNSIYPEFIESDQARQEAFLNKCTFYYDLIVTANNSGIQIIEDKKFIWLAISRLRCIPRSNLMDQIKDGQAVEIYSYDGIMVFSNFDFCMHTSYTIEELFWHPWSELFAREDKYMKQIMSEFAKATKSSQTCFTPQIDIHEAWETFHGHNRRAFVEMKMFSPINTKDKINKYMIASSNIVAKTQPFPTAIHPYEG